MQNDYTNEFCSRLRMQYLLRTPQLHRQRLQQIITREESRNFLLFFFLFFFASYLCYAEVNV